MVNVITDVTFEPKVSKANNTNEVYMLIKTELGDSEGTYWCECDIETESPISLAADRELNVGRRRIGILMPGKPINQRVNLYTKQISFSGNYKIKIVVYVYGETGAISDRIEKVMNLQCV